MGGRSRACGQESKVLAALAALLVVAVRALVRLGRRGAKTAQVAQLQTALLAQINVFRAAHGLVRLKVSGGLTGGADAPLGPDGEARLLQPRLGERPVLLAAARADYSPRGFRSWTVGENLVWGGPDIGAARAFRLWLSSPPHRANLLNARWREVGLGAVHSSSAPGVYGGGAATIVTADFGARSR